MFSKGISSATKDSLAVLAKSDFINQFYLAGGTACAFYLGHRLSFDLDFFTPKDFVSQDLADWLKNNGKFKLDQIKKDTLLGFFNTTKVSFFKYPYPLVGKTKFLGKIKVVSEQDLMAMKIDAISTRGTKRDFVDLYFLAKKNSLTEAIESYKKKYKKLNLNLQHIFRAMMYFVDADEEKEKLHMLVDFNWEKVKKYFLKEVPQVLDRELEKIK